MLLLTIRCQYCVILPGKLQFTTCLWVLHLPCSLLYNDIQFNYISQYSKRIGYYLSNCYHIIMSHWPSIQKYNHFTSKKYDLEQLLQNLTNIDNVHISLIIGWIRYYNGFVNTIMNKESCVPLFNTTQLPISTRSNVLHL